MGAILNAVKYDKPYLDYLWYNAFINGAVVWKDRVRIPRIPLNMSPMIICLKDDQAMINAYFAERPTETWVEIAPGAYLKAMSTDPGYTISSHTNTTKIRLNDMPDHEHYGRSVTDSTGTTVYTSTNINTYSGAMTGSGLLQMLESPPSTNYVIAKTEYSRDYQGLNHLGTSDASPYADNAASFDIRPQSHFVRIFRRTS